MRFQATRPAAVAGTFYPADASRLRAQVAEYLAEVRVDAAARPPKMLVVPHAGYVYSGPVAAHAYARLAPWRRRIRRVVLLGPTHRVAVRGIAAPTVAAFDTPLGAVRIDRDALTALADLAQVVAHDAAHAAEHALEVQLPFLQCVLDDFALVPLAVGHVTPQAVAEVVERLWGGDETLVVVSTDLSHYLPYDQARAVDTATVQHILQLDPALDHEQACGATPLAGALLVAKSRGLRPRLLDVRNSGDTAGDRRRVVGYCAIAFAAADGGDAADVGDAGDEADGGDRALGRALTRRARNAIHGALALARVDEPKHDALQRPGATFVTLQRGGELRGCIGSLEAWRRLDDDVRRNAHAAAFRDPRFAPLQRHEVDALRIEVSLIGASHALAARSEAEALQALRPGVDGVILEWRGRRATFLPQVWEQLPQPHVFLAALKRKAGLAGEFWAADLRIARYGVRKFTETMHA
ncbi:MAG: AmmeMemoRadiSam system protein B [Gammaproteobacteria bacterium]